MFEENQYSIAILQTKEPRVSAAKAREYWANIDAQLTALMVRRPTEVWLRQQWVPKEGENDCGKAKLVLRYRANYPPQLQGLITPQEWQAFITELNSADELRDGCIDKCTAITIFALLFYLTIIGIFFYMCAEYSCNKSRVNESMKRKKACLARFNTKYASRGITIAGRYDFRLNEMDDQGIDSNGQFSNDFLYLCITLPRPVMITTTTTNTNLPMVTPNGVMMPNPVIMYPSPSQPPMMMMPGSLYPSPQQPYLAPQSTMYPPQPQQQQQQQGFYPPQQQQQSPPTMYPPPSSSSMNGYDKSNTNTSNGYGYVSVPQQTGSVPYGGSTLYPPSQPNMMMMNTPTSTMHTTTTTTTTNGLPSAPPSDDPV